MATFTYESLMQQAHKRRARCEDIAAMARAQGWDVTWERVNRQYKIWERWYQGGLAFGYLIRRTGIHRIYTEGTQQNGNPRGTGAGT